MPISQPSTSLLDAQSIPPWEPPPAPTPQQQDWAQQDMANFAPAPPAPPPDYAGDFANFWPGASQPTPNANLQWYRDTQGNFSVVPPPDLPWQADPAAGQYLFENPAVLQTDSEGTTRFRPGLDHPSQFDPQNPYNRVPNRNAFAETLDFANKSALNWIPGVAGAFGVDAPDVYGSLPDKWYLPARQAADAITSPLGAATLPLGPGSLLKNVAINAAAGTVAQTAGEEYAKSDLPFSGTPWAPLAVGALAGAGAEGAIRGAPGATRAIGRGIDVAESRIPGVERLGPEAGMATPGFRPPEPTPPRQVPLEGAQGGEATVRPQTFDESKQFAADAVRQELRLRLSGKAESEIAAGRSRQAAGIASNLEQVIGEGGTFAEMQRGMSAGATTGTLRKTFAAPLNLPEEHLSNIMADFGNDALARNRSFEAKQFGKALSKLNAGEGLQPAEIKLLGQYFGPEVQKDIEAVNRFRPTSKATLTPEDTAYIKAAKGLERQIRQAEITAQRQGELADSLTESSRLNPTDKRYGPAADLARAKGLTAANKAAELEQKLITRTGRQGLEAEARGLKAEAKADITRKLITQLVGKVPAKDVPAYEAAISYWFQQNDRLIDVVSPDGGLLNHVQAALAGDTSDSLATAFLMRRNVLRDALTQGNMDPAIAKQLAETAMNAEIQQRFPGASFKGGKWTGLPPSVEAGLAQGREQAGPIARGIAAGNQAWKQFVFGPVDFGVGLIQMPLTLMQEGGQVLAGLVNRGLTVAHLPHMDVTNAGTALASRMGNVLDGGAPRAGSIGFTDFAQHGSFFGKDRGTILRKLPGGQFYDIPGYVGDALTHFQFNWVMGNLRDAAAEGNLMLLKALGQDVGDAAVRQTANEWANTSTGWVRGALKPARATHEQAALLSPVMTRAQVKSITDMAKLLNGTTAERILAATTITTTAASLLAIGKVVNDYFGTDEFVMEPWEKGFGDIRLKDGRHINVIPQWQLRKAIARSVDALVKGNPEDLKTTWANFGLSRSSPALQIGEAAAGAGYQPDKGYVYSGLKGDLFDRAPIPPFIQSLRRGEVTDIKSGALNLAGGNTYPESAYQERQRVTDRLYPGRKFSALDGDERAKVDAQLPGISERALATASDASKSFATDKADALVEQKRNDATFEAANGAPDAGIAWRHTHASRQDWLRDHADVYFKDIPDKPAQTALQRYYTAIDKQFTTDRTTNRVDWDAVDRWIAQQPPEDQKRITDYVSPGTPTEMRYRADMRKIEAAGYWKLKDSILQEFAQSRGFTGQWTSAEDFWERVRTFYTDEARKEGVTSPVEAARRGQIQKDKFEGQFTSQATPRLAEWRDQHHDETCALQRWGLAGTGAKELMRTVPWCADSSQASIVPGQLRTGNIDTSALPTVRNSDGTVSTVRSITIEVDGKSVLIPTVIGGRVVSNQDAIRAYRETGRNLGEFSDAASADAYAQRLHEEEARRIGAAGGVR